MVTHVGKVSLAVAYSTNASRGLSAIAELLVKIFKLSR